MTKRLSLPIQAWPDHDRQLWHDAREPMRFGRHGRSARRWSEERCRIACQSYGQWLAWLEQEGELDPCARPEDRVTNGRMEAFVSQLRERVSPWSATMMVQAVKQMLTVFAPDHDWQWLASVVSNLKRIAKPARDKRPHMVDAKTLYDLGFDLMTTARRRAMEGEHHAATMGRDGLIIALLICAPVRIRNLHQIKLGQHLRSCGDVYEVRFSAEETKTSQPYEGELPPELTPWLDFYLRVHRKYLIEFSGAADTQALWISRWGTPMKSGAIRQQIKTRTRDAFGRHVWPHLFRTIAATGVVDHVPEKAAIIPDLLCHANLATGKRHYILSSAATAHSAVMSATLDRREAARARLNAERKGGAQR